MGTRNLGRVARGNSLRGKRLCVQKQLQFPKRLAFVCAERESLGLRRVLTESGSQGKGGSQEFNIQRPLQSSDQLVVLQLWPWRKQNMMRANSLIEALAPVRKMRRSPLMIHNKSLKANKMKDQQCPNSRTSLLMIL